MRGRGFEECRFGAGLLAAFVVVTVGWLLLVTVAPAVLLRWPVVVVTSGSMSPTIRTGDLVVARPVSGGLEPGQVVVFEDSDRGGLITHRVIAYDGAEAITGGDAGGVDRRPVPREAVIGRGTLLVPLIGVPYTWALEGRWGLVAAGLASFAAVLWMSRWGLQHRYVPGCTRADRWCLPLAPTGEPTTPDPGGQEPEPAPVEHVPARVPVGALARTASMFSAGLAVAIVWQVSAAGFTAATDTSAGFASAENFCGEGTYTVPAVEHRLIDQQFPTQEYPDPPGELFIRSDRANPHTPYGARALLRFDLPEIPSTCTFASAELRVYVTAGTADRQIQAFRGDSAWEPPFTWAARSGTAGTAVTKPSITAGWLTFDVTAHTGILYQGTNTGFVLKDQIENNNQARIQRLARNVDPNPPELAVTFVGG